MPVARQIDVVVIGAGAAGLATSRELSRMQLDHVVLERGQPGDSWRRVYDSLTLHTGRHMSSLPGLPFDRGTPLFPSRKELLAYLERYASRFRLPVLSGVNVTTIHRRSERWQIETSAGAFESQALVVATGIMSNPFVPQLPGQSAFRGRIRHSVAYRDPAECAGRRVLVVGAGNSGGEIASELGRAGIDTTIAIRSGAHIVPLRLLGIPIQYVSCAVLKLPRPLQELITAAMSGVTDLVQGPPVIPRGQHSPLDAIPMIGFHLSDAVRAGQVRVRRGIRRVTADGVAFEDGAEERFEEIILATGFRAAIGFLSSLVTTDEKGFASRRDRVTSADQPDLFFVGHNYDSNGALFNIRRDATLCAKAVQTALART